MTNEYSDQPKKQIEWHAVKNQDGSQVKSKDGMGIVASEPLLLTPKLQGEFGGWILMDTASGMDIEGGFWENPRRPTKAPLEVDVPVLITLSLGGKKSTGKRYQNINEVEPAQANGSPGSTQNLQNAVNDLSGNAQNVREAVNNLLPPTAAVTPLSVDRDTSIREQAFYNHLNTDVLSQLPDEQQEALLVAYFDTAMLMLRPSVRSRALGALEESKSESQAAPEPIPEPTTEINEDEEVTELPW